MTKGAGVSGDGSSNEVVDTKFEWPAVEILISSVASRLWVVA
jgi:hypothetical protein